MEATAPEIDGRGEFVKLYAQFRQYPGRESLAQATQLNPNLLKRYREDILRPSKDPKKLPLFVEDDDQQVPFREVGKDGVVRKFNCFSEDDVRRWLFNENRPSPGTHEDGLVKRPDPRCRFVFLVNKDRGSPLQIGMSSLSRLLSFHQVSPAFLDILEAYRGTWTDDGELRFSTFRASTIPYDLHPGTVVDSLNRSGRRYQISFNLKIPTKLKWDGEEYVKVRQVGLHHQLDVTTGVQLWVVSDPHGKVKDRIQKYLPKSKTTAFGDMQTSFRSSLDIHLEILGWTVEMWSKDIDDLRKEIQKKTDIILRVSDPDPPRGKLPQLILPPVAKMRELTDWAGKTLVVLLSNQRIVKLLEQFYKQTLEDVNFNKITKEHCEHSFGQFKMELAELRSQHEMHLDHVRGLKDTVEGRMQILSQRLQRITTDALNKQALRSREEAIVMKIITIITLVFLPPTFTSTFFSMETFKDVGVSVWAIVCFPLLAVTITLAFFGGWWAILDANRKHVEDLKQTGDHQVKHRDLLRLRRLNKHMERLLNTLTFWRRRENKEGDWDLKKGLRDVSGLASGWVLRDGAAGGTGEDPEVGLQARSNERPGLR